MGTRFLLTSDSTVPDTIKQRYLQAALDGTVVPPGWTACRTEFCVPAWWRSSKAARG